MTPADSRVQRMSAEHTLRVLLRKLRRERGLSQRALTRALSLTAHSAIVDYESGRRIPPPDILAAYERHFRLADGELKVLREQALRERAGREARDALSGASADWRPLQAGLIHAARRQPAAQLPQSCADFTGRSLDLAAARRHLAETPGAPLLVTGRAGAGKTAFAVTLAHMVKENYPGGQLFARLNGSGGRRLPPGEVLGRFLRALGVPSRMVPEDVDERACLFRSVSAGRKLLVLLDDAWDEAQVRPLLPGCESAVTLITSTKVLACLEGARMLVLGALGENEARQMLAQVSGRSWTSRDDAAVGEVVRWCARLPLAIRIVGARLAARPGWSVADLAARLRPEQARLGELCSGDLSIREALAACTRRLDPAALAVFPLLGQIGTPGFTAVDVAAMAGLSPVEADRALEHMADLSLIQAAGPHRYLISDLVRLYARELWRQPGNGHQPVPASCRCEPAARAVLVPAGPRPAGHFQSG